MVAFCTVVDRGSSVHASWEIIPATRSGDDYMDVYDWDDVTRTVYAFAHGAAADAAAKEGAE